MADLHRSPSLQPDLRRASTERAELGASARARRAGRPSGVDTAPGDGQEAQREALILAGLERQADEGEAAFLADGDGRLLYSNAAMQAILPLLRAGAPDLLGALVSEALATPLPQMPTADPDRAATDVWSQLPDRELTADLPSGPEQLRLALSLCRDAAGRPKLLSGRLHRLGRPRKTMRRADRYETMRSRFDDIVRLVSDWVWETDRTLSLTYVSDRVGEKLGCHPRQLLGRRLLDLGPSPQLETLLHDEWRRPFRDLDVEMPDSQGRLRLFRLSGVPVFAHADGAFAGYRGTAHEVTQERMRERAILQAKEEAEAANRTKSEFLAAISHELRTPLNAVLGFSEVMMTEAFGPMGRPAYVEYARDIHVSAAHLLELINDILDVSKIEAGKLKLDEEETDVAALIRSSARLIGARADEGRLKLDLELAPDLPELMLDPRAFKQVLLNLLSNAVKFTAPGGRVRLAAELDGEGAFRLTVGDTGIGMSAAEIEVALTPFGQVDSSLSRRFQGTGLGLPLTKGLVELHGGRLEIVSEKPGGTQVTVTLPAARTLAPAEAVRG